MVDCEAAAAAAAMAAAHGGGGGGGGWLQGSQVHVRPAQPLTHASLFATLKQFREQQQQARPEEEEFARY